MSGEYSAQIVEDLKRMVTQGLSRWRLSPSRSLTMLNLSENATFALNDPSTRRELILRVHRVGYSTAQEILSELTWIQALRAAGAVDTASPIPAADGTLVQTLVSPSGQSPRFAVAFERLPGVEPTTSSSSGGSTGSDATGWFDRLGELTARMHQHARAWELPADFRRRRWDLEGMVGTHAHFGSWRAAIGLDPQGCKVLERALGLIDQRLARYGSEAARFGLIHADLRLANLLVDGSHLRIIDFDDCGFGWYMYDFATAVSFIEEQSIVPAMLSAWLSGYERVAPLSAAERDEIPTFIVLRRIVLTGWLGSHHEIPFAQQFGAAYTQGTLRLARELLEGAFLANAVHA
jgi:Ser/Thr protein kinase RdoA (MazF antagonist)